MTFDRVLLFLLSSLMYGESFWGLGVQALTSTQPHPTGYAFTAMALTPGQRIYSFSETDFTVVPSANIRYVIQTSARTGIASYLRSYGKFDLYVLADGGVATTGASTGGAYAGGAMICFPVTRSEIWWGNVGYRVLKTAIAGTTHQVEIGIIHRSK